VSENKYQGPGPDRGCRTTYTGHCGRMRDAFTTVSNTVALRSATVAQTVVAQGQRFPRPSQIAHLPGRQVPSACTNLVADPSLRQSTWRHFATVDIDRHFGRGLTFMRLRIQFYNTRNASRTSGYGHLLKF